jgi:hypothetical protein
MTSLVRFVVFQVCKTSILGNIGMEVFPPLAKSLKEVELEESSCSISRRASAKTLGMARTRSAEIADENVSFIITEAKYEVG